jgi:probable rRNA maturation factor
MNGELCLRNRQRTRSIDLRLLRRILRRLLNELLALGDFDLTVQLLSATKMTELNETHLRHAGSTDVITFDYAGEAALPKLAGEIFVCVDEALIQARRFRTTWQAELVRYIVHGVLHLQGHDDTQPTARRRMKREEGRRLRELARDFHLSKLERKTRVAP